MHLETNRFMDENTAKYIDKIQNQKRWETIRLVLIDAMDEYATLETIHLLYSICVASLKRYVQLYTNRPEDYKYPITCVNQEFNYELFMNTLIAGVNTYQYMEIPLYLTNAIHIAEYLMNKYQNKIN